MLNDRYSNKLFYRLFDIFDVRTLDELSGKYCRLLSNDKGILRIGHIVEDDWFDPDVFLITDVDESNDADEGGEFVDADEGGE